MRKTLCIELNEVNFDSVRHYIERGYLPTFKRLIDHHGLIETISETEYEHLEPWIQWVTVHTGKTFAEHKIFRLGDIAKEEIEQIWEVIEKKGYAVGAISPMNAKNRTSNAAFFVPDPWTATQFTGGALLRGMYDGIRQAVNDNAQARISLKSLIGLLVGAAVNARPENYARYVSLALGARIRPWNKALFLDLLLSDTAITSVKQTNVDFATIFLNAGAHIQHHYMFSAESYKGENKNPAWYVRPGLDPLKDVYLMYDIILDQIMSAFPDARFIVMTGLHQDPNYRAEYYWRLRDHAAFLRKHGVPFTVIEPRMSRDFLVTCSTASDAEEATRILASMRAEDGQELFYVDHSGRDVFVTLTYPDDVSRGFVYFAGHDKHGDFQNDVSFVAIKNGKHNGVGYMIDTRDNANALTSKDLRVPLASVFDRLVASVA
ncbi:hypothetical protein IYW40_00275 [Methylocystis sp. H4A]|uniref:hypothetical protein n=1 Tax=Methylocystis sp. H4A TaxID=2785788 RepID=UPI0018C2E075|nr:hypothetical protein [Methylocystis sp. H4A]MBG0799971.1 hypothetical protein [Methylocystis sp. H4A]